MTHRICQRLTFARKLLLAAAATAAVTGPIFIGVMNAPQSRAQANPDALTFEVASIKPADPDARGMILNLLPGGGLRAVNVRLRQLIEFAYDIQNFQISGGPGWFESQGFDILAKAPQSTEATDLRQMSDAQRKVFQKQVQQRLQALLAERFQLAIHRATKEMPVYALVVAKNGPKVKESTGGDGRRQEMRGRPGDLTGERATPEMLASTLARAVGRPVLDRTGLTGAYDFRLEWTPDVGDLIGKGGPGEKAVEASAPDPSGPSIFTALQEQLGLKLESQKGPVVIIVIDRAEKPSAN